MFVDLASISAGEGDLEVARVKLLHAATTGYAPLIFNLDDQCDYIRFLDKCKLVWKELKTDPQLPLKLVIFSLITLICMPICSGKLQMSSLIVLHVYIKIYILNLL